MMTPEEILDRNRLVDESFALSECYRILTARIKPQPDLSAIKSGHVRIKQEPEAQ